MRLPPSWLDNPVDITLMWKENLLGKKNNIIMVVSFTAYVRLVRENVVRGFLGTGICEQEPTEVYLSKT